MEAILLSHVFIRPGERDKSEIVSFTCQHFRLNNPNSYIVLAGHGELPHNLQFVDKVVWNNSIIESEIGIGHPELVNRGLDHLLEKGIENTFKMRADGVILFPEVSKYCSDVLQREQTKIFVTQQTSWQNFWMGDLLMYSSTPFLKKCWDLQNWYPTNTGLTKVAANFHREMGCDSYLDSLRVGASVRDLRTMKWIDLFHNWHALKPHLDDLLANNFLSWENFVWNQGHVTDCIHEKDWYNYD